MKISTQRLVAITCIIFIILAPLENIYRTEKVIYFACCIPLVISLIAGEKRYDRSSILVLLFWVYGIFTTLWSINPNPFSSSITFVVVFGFLFLQLLFGYSQEDYDHFKTAFIINGAILLFLCITNGYYMYGRFWIKTAESGADPNYLAGWFIIPICFCIEIIFGKQKAIIKILCALEVILSFYFIFQTGSRSGLAANAFVAIVAALYEVNHIIKKYPIRSAIIFIFSIIIIVIAYRSMPEVMAERIAHSSINMSGRLSVWMELLSQLCKHPFKAIVGFGHNSVAYSNRAGLVAHNLFLDVWFNYGIIGLVILIYFLIINIKKVFKLDPFMAIAAVGMCILAFTLTALTTRFFTLMLFMIGASVIKNNEIGKYRGNKC